jgi:hypothetical protein
MEVLLLSGIPDDTTPGLDWRRPPKTGARLEVIDAGKRGAKWLELPTGGANWQGHSTGGAIS